ncbi:gliding motility-associated-like protein [Chryseobacterium sp. 52]|uniref:gliding motility-associated C-terminal domain-containing protein n=1 Tax=Chryseobacterium sp. 52 TaxID=2035213 RepID=UPI000C1953AF|nr:gliding motility-associated C-terminal domain-containing protein [Chryseobacterium sp. 52]PIF45301.1 gliding motility-associated-like protein [Chryseobacterium sp. 52]
MKRISDKLLSRAGIFFKIPAFIVCFLLLSHPARALDLYWIGGSGNWSDINHWSLSSGNSGAMLSPSIPQAGDNVIFNSSSGFTGGSRTVSINQESSCNNVTITGISYSLILNGSVLNIYGNADFQTGTVINSSLYFKGTGANTIHFNAEVSGQAAIYFMGPGSWLVKGTLNSSGKMYFLQGSLDFGSSTITTAFFDESGCCGTVPSAPVEPRSLNLGSSVITVTGRNSQSKNQSPSWSYTGTILSAGTSRISISKGADDGYGVSFIGRNGHSYYNVGFTSIIDPSANSAYGWYQIASGNCTFKKLSFASSGFITSNCIIDSLQLAKSKTYSIYGSQKMGVVINPTQDCEPLWTLSGYGNTQAVINSSNTLNLKNVKISNIKASGTGSFIATGAIDNGNNSGWTFTANPKNLYWIGGGGNWNDTAHWSTHPDGTPSGGCIPNRNDNVFFNQFSGLISKEKPVIVNSSNAECNNITWAEVAGTPVFKTQTASDALNIYGSSIWQKSMEYKMTTTNYCSTASGNTMTSNGVEIQGDTYFLSIGEWMLNDPFLSPENDLFFRNGHLNTNNQTLTVRNFGSAGKTGLGVRTLSLGSSMINIKGNWLYMAYGGPAIYLNSGTSLLALSADEAYFYYNSALVYHDVVFSTTGTSILSSTVYDSATPCLFNSLTFKGGASINIGYQTPIHTKTLNLWASKSYVLGANMEIKANNVYVDGPLCTGLLEISSSVRGTRARINIQNPTVLANAKITDIHATGSTLTVTGGIDGGNNINVTISPLSARHFYWIGGSGNWSDPSHWTMNTGGVADLVNFCLPTAMDHVFFNQFSGKNYTVNLDIPAYCNNMIWEEVTGSVPILKGLLNNSLNINGSLILQTGMDYDVERTNFVGGNTGNLITTHGVRIDYSATNVPYKGLFFNNPTGKWMMSDALDVKNFGIIDGTFDTNNQIVNAENYYSEYTAAGASPTLTLGSSILNIAGYWDGGGLSILNAGTSTLNITGTMPVFNSSGGGVHNNEFRSMPGLAYHDVNFLNSELTARIIGHNFDTGNIFNNVSFSGEAYIDGSNQFNALRLGMSKNSHLMAGSTQTLNKLITSPNCRTWNLDNNCMSTGNDCHNTKKATIKSTTDISLDQVRISGISVIGNASYQVKGSDMGNNSGWIFSQPPAKDLYWIGGSGSWNDPTHWTGNSNGSSSGGCLPTRFDNVFFNRYSGESPKINIVGNAEFHDMTWNGVTGTPLIGGNLTCYGSLVLQSSLSHNGGIQFLASEMGNTITTKGAVVANNYDISFAGPGSYIFLDDFTTNSRITFTKGTLNTNGKTVKALSFTTTQTGLPEDSSRFLFLGASKIYLTHGGEGWSYTGGGLDAGTSHIYLTQSANVFKGDDGAIYNVITFDAGNNQTNSLYGGIIISELTFSPKNSIYQIEAGKTVTVKKSLRMSGTNCSTVQLKSTISGIQATLCLLGNGAESNFISIKDIKASSIPFILLPQSTDGGNNTNISSKPKLDAGIGLLGKDIITCGTDVPVILNATSFMPNENTSIQWTNIATGEVLGTAGRQTITASGTYRIKVVYGPDCEVTDDIKVNLEPITIATDHLKVTQPTCSIPTGSIELASIEGMTYSLDDSAYSAATYYVATSGKHTLTAKNTAGCFSDTMVIMINSQPSVPNAGISYGSTDFKALGEVNVIQTGQTNGTYSAFPTGLNIDKMTGTINLGGSIPDRTYKVTYSFTNGTCSSTATALVRISLSKATIEYNMPDYCAVGTAKVIQKGPANGHYTSSPVGLKINSLTGAVDLSASMPGMYTITYTYQDGSLNQTAPATIMVNPLPVISISSDIRTDISKGQIVTLSSSGGTSYAWIGPDIQSGQNTSILKVRPKQKATYSVIVTNSNGCSDMGQITINLRQDYSLVPNNVITPNGDGKNDTWIIKNIDYYPNTKVKIYDKAGRLIYSKQGYQNDWGGTLNGKLLNEDAYIYIIDFGNGAGLLKGTVSIIWDHQ